MGGEQRRWGVFLSSMSLLLNLLLLHCCAATNNITLSRPLSQDQILTSPGQFFVLGFFQPNNSANRYVGIWYKDKAPTKIVWVANREKPVTNSSASLTIGSDGNLKLVDGNQDALWSTNVSVPSNSSVAVLSDNGNFELIDVGTLQLEHWERGQGWIVDWEAPQNPCDVYGVCGSFGVCSPSESPICSCLRGFTPKSDEEWSRGNWTGGCMRRTNLSCEANTSSKPTNTGKADRFWTMDRMKLPDLSEYLEIDNDLCQEWCMNNCSCMGYAIVYGIGCLVWTGNITDMQKFPFGGEEFFIRLAHSEFGIFKLEDRNIVLLDQGQNLVWSSNITKGDNPLAQLLDSGNLVLREANINDETNHYLWQSFDYPTDTLLPDMKLGWDLNAGFNRFLTAWRTKGDPSSGDFSFKLDYHGFPEIFLWNKQRREYRSGPWNGLRFSGVPEMKPLDYISFNFVTNQDEVYYSFSITNKNLFSRLIVTPTGTLQRLTWIPDTEQWNPFWYAPKDQCDNYRECGQYGICDSNASPVCKCPKGFSPKNQQAWNLRDGSGDGGNTTALIIGITVSAGVLLLGLIAYVVWKRKAMQNKGKIGKKGPHERSQDFLLNEVVISSKKEFSAESQPDELELPLFDFDTIATATDNFSDEKKLGQGGFGCVYMPKTPGFCLGRRSTLETDSSNSKQDESCTVNQVTVTMLDASTNCRSVDGY
ncbi:hypothetical protein POUND7_002622 [Theobroma cacao]